jgi:hypothetical protein
LLRLLQLDNEPVARMADAVHIKNSFPIHFVCAQLFISGVTQVSNLVLARQKLIQKVNQQVFVGFCAK